MPSLTVSVLSALAVPEIQMLSTDLMTARVLNPQLATRIAAIRLASLRSGIPREAITAPLCPTAEATDTVLFQDAVDPAKRYFLPRYRLLERNQVVQATFGPGPSGGWTLTLHLESHPAPELGDAALGASPLQHSLDVLLRHRLAIGGPGEVAPAEKVQAFQEVSLEEGGARVALHVTTLNARDFLYQVLTNLGFAATLIIRRTVRLAFPMPQVPGEHLLQPRFPPPPVLFGLNGEPRKGHMTVDRPEVQPWSVVTRRPGVRNPLDEREPPEKPPREREPAKRPREEVPHPPAVVQGPAPVVVEPHPPPGIPWRALFQEVTRTIDHPVGEGPFVFPPELYGYVFSGITGAKGSVFPLMLRQVSWNGAPHSYYQDPVEQHRFYYVPDSFKLVRRPESPHLPILAVHFSSPDGTRAALRATVDYWACPHVDAARLEAASRELAPFVLDPLPPGVTGPRLEPLMAEKLRLFMTLPRGDGSTVPQELSEVRVDLRTGFRDSRTMSIEDFVRVFDALLDRSAVLFQGDVEFLIPQGPVERVPLIAQLDDMVGSVLDADVVPSEGGGLKVTLRDAIESPVRLSALSLGLQRGGVRTAGQIQEPVPALPVELAPGQSLTFGVTPAAPLEGNEPVQVAIDPRGIKVLPDRAAILSSVLRPDTLVEYQLPVTVRTMSEAFPSGSKFIRVEFQDGGSITFPREATPDQLQAKTQVRVPISDLVVPRKEPGMYTWRPVVIWDDGHKTAQPWRPGMSDDFSVTSDDLPAP